MAIYHWRIKFWTINPAKSTKINSHTHNYANNGHEDNIENEVVESYISQRLDSAMFNNPNFYFDSYIKVPEQNITKKDDWTKAMEPSMSVTNKSSKKRAYIQ